MNAPTLTYYPLTNTGANDANKLNANFLTITNALSDLYNLTGYIQGSFVETFNALITSDGTTITLTVQQSGGGDLTMAFSDGYTTFDCTPARTVELTAGSDTSPQANYVYILKSNKILTVSTSDWPSTEHIKITYCLLSSATLVQSDNGGLINQNWNDHAADTVNQGHLLHIAERSRRDGAYYMSGCGGGGSSNYLTITTNGGTPDNVTVQVNAGVIFQMHKHIYAAKDTSVSDDIHIVNSEIAAYEQTMDLNSITTDTAGGSLSNRYYNLVLWGVANKTGEYAPLMVNKPSGSYNNQAGAEADLDGYDVLTMPAAFSTESSTGFLIARITLKYSVASGGTWTYYSTVDLRGQKPTTATGGATGGPISEFPDNQFKILDDGDPTKIMVFENSGISTSTTRTLTVPDESGTLITSATTNWVDLTDTGDTTLHTHSIYSLSTHLHDTQTLQHDAVNSDGGAFAFTTSGTLTFSNTVALTTCANEGTTGSKFLTLDSSNNIDFRTAAEVLSDIGAGAVGGTGTATYLTKWSTGGADIENSIVSESGTTLTVTGSQHITGTMGVGIAPVAYFGINADITSTNSVNTNEGVAGTITWTPGSNTAAAGRGLDFGISLTGSSNTGEISGALVFTSLKGSGTIANNYGNWNRCIIRSATTRTITGTQKGIYLDYLFQGGPIAVTGNRYQIHLKDYSSGYTDAGSSTAYGIKQDGATLLNDFDGDISISTDDNYLYVGAAQDAGIGYSSINMEFFANFVGSGLFYFRDAGHKIDGTIKMKEQASADSDTAAYGQLWIKNTSPCQLWFTSDDGTDTQIV